MKNIPLTKEGREVLQLGESIVKTFRHFGVEMELIDSKDYLRDYRFELQMVNPVRMKVIEGFLEDLKYELSNNDITILAPIPDQKLIGIIVPKKTPMPIFPLHPALSEDEFLNSDPLAVPLGVSENGQNQNIDIAKAPHLLMAGTTGAGKSTLLHTFIYSLLSKHSPDKLRLILIDPKRVELTLYNSIPHLLTPVIIDGKKTISALSWAVKEMERRYDILENLQVTDITEYHELKGVQEKTLESMPYILIVIDEIADITNTYPKEFEQLSIRLAQLSRAVGIHLLLSTSRPSSTVISGNIKANIPTRIALSMASSIDSRMVLDQSGGEKLIGSGDMLYLSSNDFRVKRLQGYIVDYDEIDRLIKNVIKKYSEEEDLLDLSDENSSVWQLDTEVDDDELYEEAKEAVMTAGKCSTAYLQRKLRIGYSRAARLIDLMEERGIVGPQDGVKPRPVFK